MVKKAGEPVNAYIFPVGAISPLLYSFCMEEDSPPSAPASALGTLRMPS